VDLILMTVNALFFLGISTLLGQRYAEWMGLLYLILAGFYATLFLAIYRSQTGNKTMENLALGIAIAWLTLMVPVQFRQHIWTPLFWAAESTLLVYLSYKAGKLLMRWAGYSVFGLMAGYLLIFQTPVDVRSFLPVINQRFAAFLLGIGALYLAAWLVRRHKAKDGYWKVPVTGLIIAANILTLWLLNFEVWNTFDHQLVNLTSGKGVRNMINSLRSGRSLAITAVWAVYGVGALVTGILKKSRPVRLTGLGLLAVSIVKVFTYDVFTLETVYRITAFIGLGILLIISGYLYHRYRSFIKGFLTED
jgi:uncharacterized membrane protein